MQFYFQLGKTKSLDYEVITSVPCRGSTLKKHVIFKLGLSVPVRFIVGYIFELGCIVGRGNAENLDSLYFFNENTMDLIIKISSPQFPLYYENSVIFQSCIYFWKESEKNSLFALELV